ncbi:hypothetical protein ACFXTO_041588 [Malus domestica]
MHKCLDLATLPYTNFLEFLILPNDAVAESLAESRFSKFLSDAMGPDMFRLSLCSFFCTADDSFTASSISSPMLALSLSLLTGHRVGFYRISLASSEIEVSGRVRSKTRDVAVRRSDDYSQAGVRQGFDYGRRPPRSCSSQLQGIFFFISFLFWSAHGELGQTHVVEKLNQILGISQSETL